MATLQPPQVQPTVGSPPPVSSWGDIRLGFDRTFRLLQGLALYLQTYLAAIYNQVVPRQFIGVTVGNTESPYTVGNTESYIAASAGASADTIVNLPAATGSFREIEISKRDANAHNIAVTPNGSDTINGSAGASNITVQFDTLRLRDIAIGEWSAG